MTARGTSLTLIIAALIIGELCAHLAGAAASLIGSAMRRPVPEKAEADEVEPKSSAAGTKGDEISPKKSAPSYWMARLSKTRPDIAARVCAGEISCYRGCIEAGIRKQPAKKWTRPEDYGIDTKATA